MLQILKSLKNLVLPLVKHTNVPLLSSTTTPFESVLKPTKDYAINILCTGIPHTASQ